MKTEWNRRNDAFRHVTHDYQRTQERMLIFVAAEPHKFSLFQLVADQKNWKASTRATYWVALLAAQTALGRPITIPDKRNLRVLERAAAREIPVRAPPIAAHVIEEIILRMPDHVSLLIAITFVWGQRLSDTALMRRDRIFLTLTGWAVTFVEGKTIAHTGPYTLYMPGAQHIPAANNPIIHWINSQILFMYRTQAWVKGGTFFPPGTLQQAAARLANVGYEVRSVRRGGLQHLATAGLSPQELLNFSRHKTIEMLFRYLGYSCPWEATRMEQALSRAFHSERKPYHTVKF